MAYEWPELTFPPINLWNVPRQAIWRSLVLRRTQTRPARRRREVQAEILRWLRFR